jgi:hypothetical protein
VSHTPCTACLAHPANRGLLAAGPAIREDHQFYTVFSNGSTFAQSRFFRDERSQARDVVPSNWTADDNLWRTRSTSSLHTTHDTATPLPPLPALNVVHRVQRFARISLGRCLPRSIVLAWITVWSPLLVREFGEATKSTVPRTFSNPTIIFRARPSYTTDARTILVFTAGIAHL